MKIIKLIITLLLLNLSYQSMTFADDFNEWIESFKIRALKEGISKKTIDSTLNKVKFLPKVIEYDRYQPEFYEDTKTYISKRSGDKKILLGSTIYKNNQILIDDVENKFNVEKELLLSLMGIETNFGNYLGKMDILSSLATLSYDKRRSEFFSKELLIILKLIDQKKVDKNILYGSWAGAFGNFQFMPSTIEKYAIDYDKNNKIELKSINDSFASAANYLNKMGWKSNSNCFIQIELKENIPIKYLNVSAKKLNNKRKAIFFKKYIINYDNLNIDDKLLTAIITPDKDIVPDANTLKPAYLVFDNYELILKWNRSLRFALAVCTLRSKFKNEL